jgi:hypothetical protein
MLLQRNCSSYVSSRENSRASILRAITTTLMGLIAPSRAASLHPQSTHRSQSSKPNVLLPDQTSRTHFMDKDPVLERCSWPALYSPLASCRACRISLQRFCSRQGPCLSYGRWESLDRTCDHRLFHMKGSVLSCFNATVSHAYPWCGTRHSQIPTAYTLHLATLQDPGL